MRKGLMVILFVLCSAMIQGRAYSGDVPMMTAKELNSKLGSSELIVIDVRSSAEYNDSKLKIRGAVRENPFAIGQWLDKYPKDKTIVLYCS
ncbi:MAG: hypothetical protein L7F77_01315 [Candidatus Magnetominusculus sp. LBB02]|nr:hypothetical protein [Candidatus Magnetominusculus sp. LBB02]